ncbi:tetratricopeptide repeat protein [Pelagicoccus sp. SDUM812003]|uniref:tetratricopeptide repeat protein n=1 Tax=Pelagicoccus sp. SDUM812003 TaxID=3041267 RepID=UPI00280D21D4|nr:tetratricopeptide repeat protein [Pelagicoccus sp. SDUM812003]MDQ8204693.1 tetratricopeptide repeat protein [Pelagicoccus sp. SDUM812003]
MNKLLSKLVAAGLFSFALNAQSAVYELEEISWDNPSFVKAFTGSYAFDTEKTPSINSEEKALFETLTPLIANNPQEAIATLTTAITPESSGALDYTLANLHFQAGNTAEAISAYKAALDKFPGFARAYKNLGILYVQSGDFENALSALLKTASLGTMDGSLLGLIGFVYLNTGETASALDAYRLALIFEPDSRDWKLGKAQCLINIGENKEAISLLDELISANPNDTSLLMLQANAFIGEGEEMKAAANLQIVNELGKSTGTSLTLLGDIFINRDAPDLAVDYYIASLSLDDLSKDRLMRTIRALAIRQAWSELDQLIAATRSAIGERLSPEEETTLLNYEAQVAMGTNDDDRAASILTEVVKSDPLNGQALLLLADYYSKQNEREKAVLYYERAQDVEETEVEALIQHARMLVRERDFAEAARLLGRAQSIQPQNNVEAFLVKVESAARSMR